MAISPIDKAITLTHVALSLNNKMQPYRYGNQPYRDGNQPYRDGNQPYRYDNQPYRITYTHVGVSLSNKL